MRLNSARLLRYLNWRPEVPAPTRGMRIRAELAYAAHRLKGAAMSVWKIAAGTALGILLAAGLLAAPEMLAERRAEAEARHAAEIAARQAECTRALARAQMVFRAVLAGDVEFAPDGERPDPHVMEVVGPLVVAEPHTATWTDAYARHRAAIVDQLCDVDPDSL